MKKIPVFLLSLLAVATGLSASIDAQQRVSPPGFRVCNLTGGSIEVAKALNTASDGGSLIVSEGWYKLPPNACTTLWPPPLQYQYYLIYAQDPARGREWGGTVPVCIASGAFTIRSDMCSPQAPRRNFIQVSTMNSRNSWTHNFDP